MVMSHPLDRADYRDVQQLGKRIGVDLPCTLLQSGINQGYPNHRWDYALHELGHLVMEMAWFKSGDRWLEIPVDESAPCNDGWAEFQYKRPGTSWLELSTYNYLPSEWTVQSWCFEVSLRLGWLNPAEADQILDESAGGTAGLLRMFWSKSSIPCSERWSLLGSSNKEVSSLDSWSIRKQHELQLDRLRLYGVDFDAGCLVPSRIARAQGPYVQIVDALGTVHGRLPRTIGPEAAPFLWALWNWTDAFGGPPPGMDLHSEIAGEGWREKASWWAQRLNDALVLQTSKDLAHIQSMLHSLTPQYA
jgi:hypothetical protein